jgi:hypothetical protein
LNLSSACNFCFFFKIVLALTENLWHIQVYAEKYAEDQEAFFKDYGEAHAKLSDLGAKFDPPEVSVTIYFGLLQQVTILVNE